MKRANWILAAVAVLAVTPAIYLLSLGPAVGLASRHVISEDAFEAYFVPVPICCEGMDEDHWFARGLTSYMELWVPPDDGSIPFVED
jgi:hypothetical protein